jgi:hypothetical protein
MELAGSSTSFYPRAGLLVSTDLRGSGAVSKNLIGTGTLLFDFFANLDHVL